MSPSATALAPIAQAQGVSYEKSESVISVATSTEPEATSTSSIIGNCYAYVRYKIPTFPMASDVVPNTTPHVGAVVIMDYPHYAILTELDATGFWVKDSNWGGPGIRTHFVIWSDPHIIGFWAT